MLRNRSVSETGIDSSTVIVFFDQQVERVDLFIHVFGITESGVHDFLPVAWSICVRLLVSVVMGGFCTLRARAGLVLRETSFVVLWPLREPGVVEGWCLFRFWHRGCRTLRVSGWFVTRFVSRRSSSLVIAPRRHVSAKFQSQISSTIPLKADGWSRRATSCATDTVLMGLEAPLVSEAFVFFFFFCDVVLCLPIHVLFVVGVPTVLQPPSGLFCCGVSTLFRFVTSVTGLWPTCVTSCSLLECSTLAGDAGDDNNAAHVQTEDELHELCASICKTTIRTRSHDYDCRNCWMLYQVI